MQPCTVALRRHATSSLHALALAIALLALTAAAHGQTFTVLHAFTGGADGLQPTAGLTPGGAGTFYGTASGGGLYGYGDVFELVHHSGGWSLLPIYSFKNDYDGCNPLSPVTVGPDGSLFGTTIGCNTGTLFNLRPLPTPPPSPLTPWQLTLLNSFTGGNGYSPIYGPLIFDQAGNIYGTTEFGGVDHNLGTVWEASPYGGGWTENVLVSLDYADTGPMSGVVMDNAGNLLGTTGDGGAIFEASPSGSGWITTILHTFSGSDGSLAYGGLIKDQAGNLYGATARGGVGNEYGGVVYELTPSASGWNFQVIYNLPGAIGPYGNLAFDSAGNLYGLGFGDGADGLGMLFKLTPSNGSWTFTDLYDFSGASGCFPYGSVSFDTSGNIYGTTESCGLYGHGVVWEITP